MEITTLAKFFNKFFNTAVLLAPVIVKKSLIIIILWLSYNPLKKFLEGVLKKFFSLKKVDELLVNFLLSFLRIGLIIFYLLNVIQILGIEATSIITILGSIGLGVGLALKGSLSDLAGGIQILVSRHFVKGDYIITCGVEGTVEKINFLYTKLYTLDNKLIIIPNAKLSSDVVTNLTANKERRVDLTVSVSYETSIDKVKTVLKEILKSQPKILQNRDIFVKLIKHNSSSLDFGIRVWTKKGDYWEVYYNLLEVIKKRFDEENIEIPYNKLEIYQK